MAQTYTETAWVVKPGQEDEFIRRWQDWAEWTALQGLTASAKLLRDVEQPNRFLSFGPWESMDKVRHWRSDEGFQERIGRLQEVLESFEPRTFEQVAET
jgi:heme-degrading monooxygenase HmoA